MEDLERSFCSTSVEAEVPAVFAALQNRQTDLRRAFYQGQKPYALCASKARTIFRSTWAGPVFDPKQLQDHCSATCSA